MEGLWEQLFTHWGRGDFQAAIAFALHNKRADGRRIDRQPAQSWALTAQAEIHPEAVARYIESPDCKFFGDFEYGPDGVDCLVKVWSRSDPQAAGQWKVRQRASEPSLRSRDASGLVIDSLIARYGPEETTKWFESLNPAGCHPQALANMGDALHDAKKEADPGAAETWLLTQIGSEWGKISEAVRNAVHSLATWDSSAALDMAGRFENAFAAILGFSQLKMIDPAAASDWLRSHKQYFAYDHLAASLATSLAQTRPGAEGRAEAIAAALPWAETISDQALRDQTVKQVRAWLAEQSKQEPE